MESVFEEFDDVSISKIVRWTANLLMIFGGIVPYIPQYCEIKRLENSDGFSLFVCLVLLLANTLRILFWFGKRYEIPLLAQSILMNITMMLLIRICVRFRNKNQVLKAKENLFLDFDTKYFWKWSDFQSYIDFMLLFSVISSAFTYVFLENAIYIETLGFLAVFTEAMLGTPQLLQNYRNKSTEGMSVSMVLMWTSGDIFKTIYFLLREAPVQFWLCGLIQILIDVVILFQVKIYGRRLSGLIRRD